MKPIYSKPCHTCSRVPCPEECDNIRCGTWQRWFLASWEQLRQCPRQQMDRVDTVPLGVPLGGNYYAPPHLIRRYRRHDPCSTCAVASMCKGKCKIRKLWEQQGGIQ